MSHRLISLAALALAAPAWLAPASPVMAQTSPPVGANPERLDQRSPTIKPRQRALKAPARPRQDLHIQPFVLSQVRLEGSTAPPAVIDAATRPFIGQTIDGAALQKITDAIAAAYGAHTDVALYTVVTPTQDFAGGRLRLVVIEGYVEDVVIHGAKGRSMSLVKAYARRLTAERPLRKSVLQRYVSLIRDISGLDATMKLVAGSAEGAVRVEVDVDPHPVQAAFGVNNRGTALLGRTQVQGDLYINSLFRQGDQTRLGLALPTDTRLFQFYTASETQPIGDNGALLTVNGGYLRTRPRLVGLAGEAASLGAQFSYPVIRGYDRNLYLNLGLDGLNSHNALLGAVFSDDDTRALRLGANFSNNTAKSQFSVSATASFGLDALGAHVLNPAVTDETFSKLNLRATYNRALTAHWIVRLNGAAQLSGDRLPAAEQLTLGGADFGRAYQAALVSGDYGYAGSAELAFRPQLPIKKLQGSEVYLYADDGQVWYRSRVGFPTATYTLASAGGGVRLAVLKVGVLELEAARGLTNPVPNLEREGWRGIVTLRTLF